MITFKKVSADEFFEESIIPVIEGYKKCAQEIENEMSDLSHLTTEFYKKTYKENVNNRYALILIDGQRVGFICIEMVYQPHFGVTIAEQNILFILPQFRKKVRGVFNFLKQFAKDEGAKALSLNAPYGSKLERVYKRMATPVYTCFYKTL